MKKTRDLDRALKNSDIIKKWHDIGFTRGITNPEKENMCAECMESLMNYIQNNNLEDNVISVIGFAMIRKVVTSTVVSDVDTIIDKVIQKSLKYDTTVNKIKENCVEQMNADAEACAELSDEIIKELSD